MEHTIKIAGGKMQFIYADDLSELSAVGYTTVERVSHVEPYDGSGGPNFSSRHPGIWWTADMRPIGGPVLGPYPTREEALTAERVYLQKERGL